MTASEGTGQVARGAITIMALRVAGIGLGLGVALVLGRTLGVAGYGAYSAGMGLASIATSIATPGAVPLLVRSTAAYIAGTDAALLRGLIARVTQAVLAAALLAGGATALLLLTLVRPSPVREAMIAAAPLIPILALTSLSQAILQGLRRMAQAFAPSVVVRPVVFLAILALAGVTASTPSPAAAILLQGGATAAALALTLWWQLRSLPSEVRDSTPRYETMSWARSAVGLGISSGMATVTAGIGVTLVGFLRGGYQAGLLGAATRVSVLVLLASWAANQSLAPSAARLHQRGERSPLQQQVTGVTRNVAGATLALAVGVALFARPLLALFGPGFRDGAPALRILCAAAMVNAGASGNMTLLLMTGHQRSAAVASGAGLVTAVALSLALIPSDGAVGSAEAFLAGTFARNVVASRLTWRRLGIESTVIGCGGRVR